MKWKTFLQILLLLIIAKALFSIGKYGDRKSRYQYTGKENSYSRISFTDPNTKRLLYEYIPVESWGVFDTWNGKLYTTNDLTNEVILEQDIINRKIKVHLLPKGTFDLPPEALSIIDFEKMQEEVKARLEREQNKQRQELLKSLIQK